AVIIFLSSFLLRTDGQQLSWRAAAWRVNAQVGMDRAPAPERGVSRRRKGWGVLRRGESCWGVLGVLQASFALPPDPSILRVLNDYATIREFFADAVGCGEIALFLSSIALGNQLIDLRVAWRVNRRAISERTNLCHIVVFDHCKHFLEGCQKFLSRVNIALAEVSFVHRHVRFADQAIRARQGSCSVQVLRKARVELFRRFGDALRHSLLPSGKIPLPQPVREVPQP